MLLNYSQLHDMLSDPILHGSSNSAEFRDFLESDTELDFNNQPDMNCILYLFVEGNYTGVSTVEGVEFRPVKYNLGKYTCHCCSPVRYCTYFMSISFGTVALRIYSQPSV
jgi:hypothetical protein